jgi:GT2 family glycosyltransferase
MCKRELFSIIGEIDSEFPFWFADNIYAEQLKRFGVKHAVVLNSVVKHLGSSTLNTINETLNHEYTKGLIKKFIEKHPTNESAIYFKRHA